MDRPLYSYVAILSPFPLPSPANSNVVIANPACEEVGCGEWKPREIKNPKYKGKWVRPTKKNPEYIGKWFPRKIPNPNYYEDNHPANFPKMVAVRHISL